MSTAQWANIGDDAGALHALLQRVTTQVAVDAVDYLWIFPPRKIAVGESVVIVVGAFEQDPDRRRVITGRFTVSRNRRGVAAVKERFDEHGSAPTDAIPRIVQGVLRRLGEDAEAEPRAEQIAGDFDRWDALVVDLGGRPAARPESEDDAPASQGSTPAAAHTTDSADAADADADADAGPPAPAQHDDPAVSAPPVPDTAASAADGDSGDDTLSRGA